MWGNFNFNLKLSNNSGCKQIKCQNCSDTEKNWVSLIKIDKDLRLQILKKHSK